VSDTKSPNDPDAMRSPIRPTAPSEAPRAPQPLPRATQQTPALPQTEAPINSLSAMDALRAKMELIADEFAQGKINRAQFNAMYERYSEQRTIIERLIERNPESDAWKQVLNTKGHTGFLRSHFAAQAQYYLVYRHTKYEPILSGGRQQPNEELLKPVLGLVWSMRNRPKAALGRKQLGERDWLILACGEHAATAVMFSAEPSNAQARLVRDLHADFERANQAALARGWIVPERMVFPQRALVEGSL
jgi:hypothetical protein